MNKNKIMSVLVCVFALLIASFAVADAADVTGPTEDIVVGVDYSELNDDSDDPLTYTRTLTFENTAEACPVDCDTECETECADWADTDALCTLECAEAEPDEDCVTCMVANYPAECTDCAECQTTCGGCTDVAETVDLALTDAPTGYTVELSEETFDLLPEESKEVTLTVTVPISADSGSHDLGDLTWTVGGVDTVVNLGTDVASMLELKWLKFYIDGSKEDTIDESGEKTNDVAPGNEVEFRFQVENIFDDNDYNEGEIENIVLTMEFVDNDDEDDFEDEIDEEEEFDLNPDAEETVVFDFKVPTKAKEGTYDLVVRLSGEDGNGAEHNVEWIVSLDIDREKDDVRVEKAYLQTETLVCGGETLFKVKVANYGSNDQDEVALNIVNSALGINVNVMDVELDEDPDDDDNSYTKTIPVSVSEDFAAGEYTIDVRVYIDGDEEVDHRLVKLTVIECAGDEVVEEDEEVEESEEDVILQTFDGDEETSVEETTTGLTGATTVIETVETAQSRGMTAFMVVVIVLLVLLIALMLGILLKK